MVVSRQANHQEEAPCRSAFARSRTFHGRFVVNGERAPKPARATDEILSLEELAAMLDGLDG